MNIAFDETRRAVVRSKIEMRFRKGADAAEDRLAYVRAASGLLSLSDSLLVVQDDANVLALVEPASGLADAILLPRGEGGRRVFEERLGNKHNKMDLESCVRVGDECWIFGSGSLQIRTSIVRLPIGSNGLPSSVRIQTIPKFYATLSSCAGLTSSQLNLEGVAVVGGSVLRFFQRGIGTQESVSAFCDVSLSAFGNYIDGRGEVPPPIDLVEICHLPSVSGVPYGFTDASSLPDGTIAFLAAAEDSPNAVDDGVVYGTALGWMSTKDAVMIPLVEPTGAPFLGKPEGLCLGPAANSYYVVVDRDDPDLPSELLVVTVEPGT